LHIIVHRGTRQIGGSIIELATENTRIILDIGEELPKSEDESEKTAAKYPYVEGLFEKGDKTVDAILISHSHGDHVGLYPYVNQEIPIYIGEKSCEIYNMTRRFIGSDSRIQAYDFLKHGNPIRIGDFTVTPYLVDHSAYDAHAFVIQANGKSVVYTGDIREHGKKGKLTSLFMNSLPKGTDVLLTEGTMLGRMDEKLITEDEIKEEATQLMSSVKQPVLVFQSSTNIDRLVAMYHAAKTNHRTFVIDIYTAAIIDVLGGSVGNILKKARVIYPYHLTDKMFQNGEKELMYRFAYRKITIGELNENPQYCMIVRSSMLGLIQNLSNLEGGLLIYSMWQGYRENSKVKRVLDHLEERHVERKHLHTSGHGGIQTLLKIANQCQAKRVIPIHTEHSEKFKDIFENVYLLEDKEVFIV
jgi:ribonuclease J